MWQNNVIEVYPTHRHSLKKITKDKFKLSLRLIPSALSLSEQEIFVCTTMQSYFKFGSKAK